MINRKEHNYEGIPFSLVYEDLSLNKPVVFFFHGYSSDRFNGPMEREIKLASMGYTVILLDAYNHGERKTQEFESLTNEERQMQMIDIEIHTAKDAIKVYDYLVSVNMISSEERLAAYGVSMGAATSFYLATIFSKLEVIVTLVGSPSFVNFYEYKRKLYKLEKTPDFIKNTIKYRQMDPLLNYERFNDKKVFIAVGLEDNVVPMGSANELSKLIDCEYCEYKTGHISTSEMLDDAYRFLSKELGR